MGVREMLLCIGAKADEAIKEEMLTYQNPSRQKRGGLGLGAHATVRMLENGMSGKSFRTNINLYGSESVNATLSIRDYDKGTGKFSVYSTADIVATGNLFKVPEWYNRTLSTGKSIYDVLQLHMGHELVGIIGATKCSLLNMNKMCQFCSLSGGNENTRRTTGEIIEALTIINDYPGNYNNIALSTTLFNEDEFKEITSGIHKIKLLFPDKKLALECQPLSPGQLLMAKMATVDTLMMPLDCFSEQAQQRIIPGKKELIDRWLWSQADYATELFGVGNVVSNIIVGAYEDVDNTKLGIKKLIDYGLYPDPIPVRVFDQSKIMTDPVVLEEVIAYHQDILVSSGFKDTMGTIHTGCASCGGCSLGLPGKT